MKLKSYRELMAWQRAMDLVVQVYEVSGGWPREEIYGLTRQVRNAAVSVPANIAEGQGRCTTREFIHFLGIAYGSLMEVETELLAASRLGFRTTEQVEVLLAKTSEVARLLNGLSASLERKLAAPPKHDAP